GPDRPALADPAGVDARHPRRLGGAPRPLPHRARGRRPRPGHLGPRPRRGAAGPAPRGRVPPRSRASRPRAGAARGGGRLRLLARRPEGRARALWEPRLPRRAARGGDRGRQELPRRVRAPPGRDRPHLLRRRRHSLLLPARGREECHVPDGVRPPGAAALTSGGAPRRRRRRPDAARSAVFHLPLALPRAVWGGAAVLRTDPWTAHASLARRSWAVPRISLASRRAPSSGLVRAHLETFSR